MDFEIWNEVKLLKNSLNENKETNINRRQWKCYQFSNNLLKKYSAISIWIIIQGFIKTGVFISADIIFDYCILWVCSGAYSIE